MLYGGGAGGALHDKRVKCRSTMSQAASVDLENEVVWGKMLRRLEANVSSTEQLRYSSRKYEKSVDCVVKLLLANASKAFAAKAMLLRILAS